MNDVGKINFLYNRLLFPYEYKVSKETLIEDERFVMSNFGKETAVSIKE